MVALVVTIIIMLILVGVTLNLTIGSNGLITRAKQAKKDIEQASLNEQFAMNELYDEMMIATDNTSDDISTDGIPPNIVDYVQKYVEQATKNKMLDRYPVGSIYISTSSQNPSELFDGTTWESYGEGKTLVGVSEDGESEQTGGSNTVTLAEDNLPSHSHSIPSLTVSSWTGSHGHSIRQEFGADTNPNYSPSKNTYAQIAGNSASTQLWSSSPISSTSITVSGQKTTASSTGNVGTGTSFSVKDPYITVYMWKRIE